MTLGMDEKELKQYFETEYMEIYNKCFGLDEKRMEKDFINQGIPENEARLLALSQVQFEATSQAVLRTILTNNARIEIQLKDKGIKL